MLQIRSAVFAVMATATLGLAQAQVAAPASASSPTAVPAKPAARKTAPAPNSKMDLKAPPLSHIYPSRELQYILAPDDDSGIDSAAEVSVKGTKNVVRVPGAPGNQLQAVPWAILHPTQAWRIFTPLESP